MSKVTIKMASFGWRGYIPAVVSLGLTSLMLLPVGTGVSNVAMPHFAMMCIFYWTASRPLLMPYGLAASLGLVLDLWLNVPMGLNMLILVLARLFVISQIKYFKGRSRLVYWGVFCVMAIGLYTLSWVIISFITGHMVAIEPVLRQLLLTLFSYGIIGLILGRIRRAFLA